MTKHIKFIINALSLVSFFVAYKFQGIYAATAALVVISNIQLICAYCKVINYGKKQVFLFFVVLTLCGATIIFENDLFIKFKPTVIYWLCGIFFWYNKIVNKKDLIKQIAPSKFVLGDHVWRQINNCWIGFFLLMGSVNVYVVYNYSTDEWVYFKVFGMLGTTVLFVILQTLLYILYKYSRGKASNS